MDSNVPVISGVRLSNLESVELKMSGSGFSGSCDQRGGAGS